jgi:hypothetical protein
MKLKGNLIKIRAAKQTKVGSFLHKPDESVIDDRNVSIHHKSGNGVCHP